MYQHNTSPFGQFTQHTIQDEAGLNRLTVVPGFGTCMLDLTLSGVPLLDAYETPLDMDINRWGKNVLLFPFPNRLKEGTYTWGGETYHFFINDAITNNALHGLGMNSPMVFSKADLQENKASISCVYDYAGDNAGYPFPFHFSVNFQIEKGRLFNGTFVFKNKSDQSIPVGLGWHPYFKLSEKVDDIELLLPPCEMIGIDQHMIPTGKRYEYDDFDQKRAIGAAVLDNCFALTGNETPALVELKGPKGQVKFWQETGPRKFNFLQVFTPPHRQSIAIEPMTCNIDAFNNEDGLVALEAGEEWELHFGFEFVPRG